MDKNRFLEGMARLTVSFPGQLDEERARLRAAAYREALSDLSDEAWELAVRRAIREEKFFPSAARLREFAGPTTLAVRTEAALAFRKLFEEPRRNGLTRYSPETGDRIIGYRVMEVLGPVAYQAFVAVGGSSRFDEATDAGRPFLERDFLEAFREADVEFRRTGELPAAAELMRLPGRVREIAAGAVKEFPEVRR